MDKIKIILDFAQLVCMVSMIIIGIKYTIKSFKEKQKDCEEKQSEGGEE